MSLRRDDLPDLGELLANSVAGADPGERFDRRVLREWSLYRHARTLRFWAPALLGAAVASLAVLAALEIIVQPATRPAPVITGHEARMVETGPSIPDFRDPGVRRPDR